MKTGKVTEYRRVSLFADAENEIAVLCAAATQQGERAGRDGFHLSNANLRPRPGCQREREYWFDLWFRKDECPDYEA